MTKRTIARRGLLLAGLSLLVAATSQPAFAEYPERPVKIVLPLGPGGVGDISARIVADKLGEKLGQRFIIAVDTDPAIGQFGLHRRQRNALALLKLLQKLSQREAQVGSQLGGQIRRVVGDSKVHINTSTSPLRNSQGRTRL